jgi:hypothetical protein
MILVARSPLEVESQIDVYKFTRPFWCRLGWGSGAYFLLTFIPLLYKPHSKYKTKNITSYLLLNSSSSEQHLSGFFSSKKKKTFYK